MVDRRGGVYLGGTLSASATITGESARTSVETYTATAAQTVFTLVDTYTPGIDALDVYVDGVLQTLTTDYVETDEDTVTFVSGLSAGQVVTFRIRNFTNEGSDSTADLINFTPDNSGIARSVNAKLNDWIAFEDFGAVGDGSTDDSDAIEDALVAALATGKTLTGRSGATYKLARSLTHAGQLVLKGDFTIAQTSDHDGLIVDPTRSLAAATVSAVNSVQYPASTGIEQTTSLTVGDATGLAVNDVCLLYSDDTYAFDSNVRKAELVKINAISGTTVYLAGNVVDSYTTTIRLLKLNAAVVDIDGPTFTFSGDAFASTSVSTRAAAVTLIGCVAPRVRGRFMNDVCAGVSMFTCWAPNVDVIAQNLRNNQSYAMFGYGVVAYGATARGLIRVQADNVRHAYTDGTWQTSSVHIRKGRCVDMVLYDGIATNTSFAAWDTHPGSLNTVFDNCGVVHNVTNSDQDTKNNSYGFQDRAINTRFVNCWSRGVRVPFYFGQLAVNNGATNRTEVVGGHFKRSGTTTSTVFAGVPAKTSSDTISITIRNTVFDGFMPNQSAQASLILSFHGCEFIADGTYGMALTNSTGPMAFYGCTFREMSQLRCGQSNNMVFIGCRRINSGSSVEAMILGVGSTNTIHDYYAEAGSFGSSRIIQGGNGTDAGTVTLNLGTVTAKGGLAAPVVSNGVATFTINYGTLDKHADGAAGTPSISFVNDPDTGWYSVGANVLGAATGGTNRVTINSSGIGIGTTPAVTVDANNATDARFRLKIADVATAQFQATSALARLASVTNIPLFLMTNGNDRVKVKETGQVRFIPLGSDPSGAETGDVYYNSSTNKLRVYNGAWVDLH